MPLPPTLATFLKMVLLAMVNIPMFKMPPTKLQESQPEATLPDMVLLMIVAVPSFSMPPSLEARLLEMVLSFILSFAPLSLKMAPMSSASFSVRVLLVTVSVPAL